MTPEEKKTMERKAALEELVQLDLQDIRIRAMEPPNLLLDMRFVAEGRKPSTDNQARLLKLYKEDYGTFLREWRTAEREYRVCLRDLEEKWGKNASGLEVVDGGYERLRKLLGETNVAVGVASAPASAPSGEGKQ